MQIEHHFQTHHSKMTKAWKLGYGAYGYPPVVGKHANSRNGSTENDGNISGPPVNKNSPRGASVEVL